jgi:hypothetical protein
MLLVASALVVVWALPLSADAFYILSPKTEACHEHIMLGSLQATQAPFGDSSISTAALLAHFVARAEDRSEIFEQGTRAFTDEISERFGLDDRSRAEQFILASFVAGVRHPDTDGLSVVKFNETRSLHLQDRNQPKHALRKSAHDHEAGDADSWRSADGPLVAERWSFSFYGAVEVWIFGPAFQLGQASHVVQDAFAHALRDDHLRITAMGNFVDALQKGYSEPRDGPAHSDRLDECDVENSVFDEMRVVEARDATATLLAATAAIFEGDGGPGALEDEIQKRVDPALDRAFAHRPGCSYDNDYCGSDWAPIADSDPTEPYELTFCSAESKKSRTSASDLLLVAALASVFLLWRMIRFRSRRAIS